MTLPTTGCRLAALLAATTLAVCGCGSTSGAVATPPTRSPSAAPSRVVTPSSSTPSAQPAEPALTSSGFSACVAPGQVRPLLVVDGGLHAGSPLTLERVGLDKADGVRLAQAWVGTADATTPATADYDWPLTEENQRALGSAWKHRQAVAGAPLEPGNRYVLLLHVEPQRPRGHSGYRSAVIGYRTGDGSFRAHGSVKLMFDQGC